MLFASLGMSWVMKPIRKLDKKKHPVNGKKCAHSRYSKNVSAVEKVMMCVQYVKVHLRVGIRAARCHAAAMPSFTCSISHSVQLEAV